jgi:PadR family transcriptional regulator PadR
MNLLTRSEEFVLLAVWRLQEGAYTLNIRERLTEFTSQNWSLGSVYTPLERLSRRRLLTSRLSESTPDRGGRKRRIYELTLAGKKALVKIRSVEKTMWAGVNELLPDA